MKKVYVITEQESEITKSDYPRWGFAEVRFVFSSSKKAEKQLYTIVDDIINKGGNWFCTNEDDGSTYEIVKEEQSSTFYKSVTIKRTLPSGEKQLFLWKINEKELNWEFGI